MSAIAVDRGTEEGRRAAGVGGADMGAGPGEGRFDLHVHTTASDGTWDPARVVREAARLGLAGVAITDHDTVAGVAEGVAEGARAGITVVPGVEVGAERGSEEVHVLGYFVDVDHRGLRATLLRLQGSRERRMERMAERVARLGMPVSLQRVRELAAGGALGRPHMARALVEAGYATSVKEAFERFLERGRPGYVPREHISPEAAVGVIREAGGAGVLAHPGLLRDDSFIPDLVACGLAGIEVYYPEHGPEAVARYRAMARRLGLMATGGSDFHGGPDYPARLGQVTVPARVVADLARLARVP
ncbi:MAG: PHP domain-containing protein [Bacillota bacterium]|nr:PHP domain-containing protein [Bacillota bacterium]